MRISDYAISISDCFSDLLCAEDSGTLSTDSPADCSPVSESPPLCSDEASIAGFIEDECNFIRSFDQSAHPWPIPLDSSARTHSVSWILKVRAFYGFHALTAYLAVNYFDRFLSSYRLPESNGWTLQLLSVACLSLAAKMEEPLVPLLHHFQVEGAKFVFRPRTIQRMELLVLGVLHWRLQTVTPFSFISFFTSKIDVTGTFMDFLISRSTDIILSYLQEASFLEYRASSIAASAVLYAASEIPKLSLVTPEHAESWCDGLSKEKVVDCYKLMQNVMMMMKKGSESRKAMNTERTISDCSSSPSICSSSSSTSPSYNISNTKRRKLNSSSWIDVPKEKGVRCLLYFNFEARALSFTWRRSPVYFFFLTNKGAACLPDQATVWKFQVSHAQGKV
ncbi:hypothetical protein V2J09_003746 [Rumex salicifolius]